MQAANLRQRPGRPIRAVFFDFDGVLTTDRTGSLTTLRFLSQATGIALAALREAFTEHNDALNLGRTSHAQIWPAVCRRLGTPIDIGLLEAAFESTPLNTAMFRLARRLRQRCSVGIITDNKKDRMDCLKVSAALPALFDPIVVSAEAGSDKRGPLIFERALTLAAARPGECVFIDNSRDNLVAPAALGLHTIFFDDERNDVQGLAVALGEIAGLELRDEA